MRQTLEAKVRISSAQPNGLVEGHENRAVVEFDEAALREEVGEARSMAARHGAVVDGPDYECRFVEGPQPLGCLDETALGCGGHVLPDIAPDAGLCDEALGPPPDDVHRNWADRHPSEGHGQALEAWYS